MFFSKLLENYNNRGLKKQSTQIKLPYMTHNTTYILIKNVSLKLNENSISYYCSILPSVFFIWSIRNYSSIFLTLIYREILLMNVAILQTFEKLFKCR